jgi:hypothetical protein
MKYLLISLALLFTFSTQVLASEPGGNKLSYAEKPQADELLAKPTLKKEKLKAKAIKALIKEKLIRKSDKPRSKAHKAFVRSLICGGWTIILSSFTPILFATATLAVIFSIISALAVILGLVSGVQGLIQLIKLNRGEIEDTGRDYQKALVASIIGGLFVGQFILLGIFLLGLALAN